MAKIEDGGPAFPNTWDETNEYGVIFPFVERGMSLRDYFAGQALPAVISATSAGQHMPTARDSDTSISFAIARDAYLMADAMLALRAQEGAK